jgi:hypothetical protein
LKLYRYVSEAEAEVIRRTGIIPNVDSRGDVKTVYFTDHLYKTAGRAKSHLQLPVRPSYRVEIDPASIPGGFRLRRINPLENPHWGRGGGTEASTRALITVDPSTLTPLSGGSAGER